MVLAGGNHGFVVFTVLLVSVALRVSSPRSARGCGAYIMHTACAFLPLHRNSKKKKKTVGRVPAENPYTGTGISRADILSARLRCARRYVHLPLPLAENRDDMRVKSSYDYFMTGRAGRGRKKNRKI